MLRKIRVRTNCSNYCPIFFFVLVFNLFNVIKVSELRTKLLNPTKYPQSHRTPTSRIPIIIVKLAFFSLFQVCQWSMSCNRFKGKSYNVDYVVMFETHFHISLNLLCFEKYGYFFNFWYLSFFSHPVFFPFFLFWTRRTLIDITCFS